MDGITHYEHLQAEKARVLAMCPPSHRARILGQRPNYSNAKFHEITVDLRTGERSVIVGPDLMAEKVAPVARPSEPELSLSPVSVRQIMGAVGRAWNIKPYDLISPLRSQRASRPRFAVYWLLTLRLGLSTPLVGRLLGKRDHTTVVTGLRRARTLLDHDLDWRGKYDAAVAELDRGESP